MNSGYTKVASFGTAFLEGSSEGCPQVINDSRVGSSRQGCESRGVKVPPPSVAQNGRLAYPLLGEVTDRDMRGRKSHGRPVYYRNSGGSNLGGEQIYGPEDKQIIAASKDTHTEVAVWIKLSADRFNTSGRPLFCGKKWV